MLDFLRRQCDSCRKKVLFFNVKFRYYFHPVAGRVKSEGQLCTKCEKGISKLFATMKVDKPVESGG